MNTLRPWALPLVPLYRAGSSLGAALYRAGALRSQKLQWPVISVGSLSAGGAGKTPVVIALTKMLQERGWHVDVLSRGYGRAGKGNEQVVPGILSPEQMAQEFGDEPTLIALRTEASVWVGTNRYKSGLLAESPGCDWRTTDSSTALRNDNRINKSTAQNFVHILDDGLQHRRLARDFDIVLVTAEDLYDTLLPAGNLREPPAALHRADAIVIRDEEREAIEEKVRELAGPQPPLWTVRRTLHFPQPLGVFSAGLRPLAFCAIARPEGFAALLQSSGCGIIDTVIFDDHHRYHATDIAQLVKTATELKATGFVTTEKDAVKLSHKFRQELEAVGPLVVVTLDADFIYKAPVMRTLEARLKAPARQVAKETTADIREALVR